MKTLFVSFEGYFKNSGVTKYTGTTKQSLIDIHKNHLCGLEDESLSEQQLIEKIDEVNGDGCDYIISIISSSGEVLYACSQKNKKS